MHVCSCADCGVNRYSLPNATENFAEKLSLHRRERDCHGEIELFLRFAASIILQKVVHYFLGTLVKGAGGPSFEVIQAMPTRAPSC